MKLMKHAYIDCDQNQNIWFSLTGHNIILYTTLSGYF